MELTRKGERFMELSLEWFEEPPLFGEIERAISPFSFFRPQKTEL
jgi:hypothetical protein